MDQVIESNTYNEFLDECVCDKYNCTIIDCDGSCGCSACWLNFPPEGLDKDY